ncbi:cyclopropane-fatty-acyl-phospholipid synthase family protein [Robbsia sp. KACC 23696]|uniref:SAM-dependent methyltransferase n=1 Tax=Robbsia sp. KACC 23696 TaxID=3149231 RepID=UPI00325C0638
MNPIASLINVAERLPLPDTLTLAGIAYLVDKTARKTADQLIDPAERDAAFAADMQRFPIAVHTDASREQHYEIPAAFFALMLGPRRKYSCGYYVLPKATHAPMHADRFAGTPLTAADSKAAPDGQNAALAESSALAQAEEDALARSCAHAELRDGQRILELGCGWGSLTIWMAQHYPAARITAVSHSASQRAYIESVLAAQGLRNVEVITADMNDFRIADTAARFDRAVSIEMFEHMANWRGLLERVRQWLVPGGKLFLHVFSNQGAPYRFDHTDPTDWIAQHFFTGGIMPSHTMIAQFDDLFALEKQWRWDGTHYERTAQDWLSNFDRNSEAIDEILRDVYGADASLWKRRWRLFLLSTIGLFGHRNGAQWGVSHYRLVRRDDVTLG